MGSLRFLVSPDWRSLVRTEDVNYIRALLEDFPERAKEQPEGLFEHLCSLGVGPLVTRQTGERISDHVALVKLCSEFVQV
jgi:hypothetical protein